MDSNTIQKLVSLYSQGKSVKWLCQELNRHRSTIQKYLKRSNVKLRRRSNHYECNHNFFNSFSPETCYWAGFIMADGCVRQNTLHIKLAIKDREHLVKFLKAIQSNNPICFDKEKTYCYINISSCQILKDLKNNFEIIPRKTHFAIFPNLIPNNLQSHFTRGIFDGDGCITWTTCPTISFIGTIPLINSLNQKFLSLGIKLKSGNLVAPLQLKGAFAQIHYSGKNAKLILDWLYLNPLKSILLDRKLNRYKELFPESHSNILQNLLL